MNVIYHKQNSQKTSAINISQYPLVKVVIGKQMKSQLIQFAMYQGLQGGKMIAKGYISVNTMFNLAHNNKIKIIFNKRKFKNLL
jgi:hypothetical protein